MNINSRKRKHSNTHPEEISKKLCTEFSTDLSNDFIKDSSDLLNDCHENSLRRDYFSSYLIKLMYQLDFSVFCLLRNLIYKHKYPSLKISFEVSEFNKFNDVVLCYKEKSICLQIESVNTNYIIGNINYSTLFAKGKICLNNYFNYFVKHSIYKPYSLLSKAEYLIIFTNLDLDLSKENRLRNIRCKNFYPFKLDSINPDKNIFFIDILSTTKDVNVLHFYQFSKDKIEKEELLRRLEFSPAVQKMMKDRKFSKELKKDIKIKFVDKLVLAVSQSHRAELKGIIKTEAKKVKCDYAKLQKKILCSLVSEKLGSKIVYEFNVLISNLHDMVLHNKISCINLISSGSSNIITLYYKKKVTYIKVVDASIDIDYSNLFPSIKQEGNSDLTINKYFSFFVEEMKNNIDIKFFILYTNVSLNLGHNNVLRRGQSATFSLIKFDKIDNKKRRFKVLRKCSCINNTELYQFSREEEIKNRIINLLRLPPALQIEKDQGNVLDESEQKMKEMFLHKLVFAVNQPSKTKLNNLIVDEIEKKHLINEVKYDYEELHEVTLRWLESHEYGTVTKSVINKILYEIKYNISSFLNVRYKYNKEEISFAKSIVNSRGVGLSFHQFFHFITIGEGKSYLEVIRTNGIKLRSVSSILHGTRNPIESLKNFYKILFDENGYKTKYLKNLERNNISFTAVSNALTQTGFSAAETFRKLHDLWFDEEGNKTYHLECLQKHGIRIRTILNIIRMSGSQAPKLYINLFDLWFDKNGNKTQLLKNLEKEKISLHSMSNIILKSGSRAVEIFKELYNLFIDKEGKKTEYLKTLNKNQIALSTMSSILGISGIEAVDSFTKLHRLWFDDQGNKTRYLTTLDKHGINILIMSIILSKAGRNCVEAYKKIFDAFFDTEGNKTRRLNVFEKNGINLSNIAKILRHKGNSAAKTFNILYNILFDKNGNKTQYFTIVKEKGMNLANLTKILSGSDLNAAAAFNNLYEF